MKIGIAVRGYFRFEAFKANGERRVLMDWTPNVVLSQGLNRMGKGSFAGGGSYCHIGTSGVTPQPTDTGLVAWFDSTNDEQAQSDGAQGTEPWYGWDRRTYRFAIGTFPGGTNIAEVGIGWGATNTDVFNRTVPVDLSGVPTTVVPQATEGLDVLYECRYYPMLGDIKNVVSIQGEDYDTITRASRVTSGFQHNAIGQEIGAVNGSNYFAASTSDLTDVDLGPNAEDDLAGTAYDLSYIDFSHKRTIVANCGISGWNVPGAVVRTVVCSLTAGQFQTQFDRQSLPGAGFPKATDQSAELRWEINWSAWLLDGTWQRAPDDDVTTPSDGAWNMNTANTVLRISWQGGGANSRRAELQVLSGTVFHLQTNIGPEDGDWIEYEVDGAYTEGADYTEYNVINPVLGASGSAPSSGNVCTVRAVYP